MITRKPDNIKKNHIIKQLKSENMKISVIKKSMN